MGGPCCKQEIEAFLYNLFSDEYIIQLPYLLKPFQKQLAEFIASRRAPKVVKNYEMIGGRSPILFETQAQAKALEKRLGKNYKSFIAMRYSYPFLKDTLEEIENSNINDLTVIPLYPHYSLATSGSSLIEAKQLFSETGFAHGAKIRYIESWFDNLFFIELISRRIEDKIEELKLDNKASKSHILFSAHGLPVSYIANGDPYQNQVEHSVNLVVQRIADQLNLRSYKNQLKSESYDLSWSISYQSRVGPIKWLEPSTEAAIHQLALTQVENLIVVPISFVGDHIETLHEINIEYRKLAEENGITKFAVTRLPKANSLLIEALASLILANESPNLRSRIFNKSLSDRN